MNVFKSFERRLRESITQYPEVMQGTARKQHLKPSVDEQYDAMLNILSCMETDYDKRRVYPALTTRSVWYAEGENGSQKLQIEVPDQSADNFKVALQSAGRTLYELFTGTEGAGRIRKFKSPFWPIIDVMCEGTAVQNLWILREAVLKAYERDLAKRQRLQRFWNGVKKIIGVAGSVVQGVFDFFRDCQWLILVLCGISISGSLLYMGYSLIGIGGIVWSIGISAVIGIITCGHYSAHKETHPEKFRRLYCNIYAFVFFAVTILINGWLAGTLQGSYDHPPFVYDRVNWKYSGRVVLIDNTLKYRVVGLNTEWVNLLRYEVVPGFPLEGTIGIDLGGNLHKSIRARYVINERLVAHPSNTYAEMNPRTDITNALLKAVDAYISRYLAEAGKRTYTRQLMYRGADLLTCTYTAPPDLVKAENAILLEGLMRTVTSVNLPEPWSKVASVSFDGLVQ